MVSQRRPRAPTIQLLGAFRVVGADGVALPDRTWSRRKAAAVVKLLALESSRRLHREQVIEYLWPDLSAAAAINQLNKSVHYARAALTPALGAGAIHVEGGTLVLSPSVRTDVERFLRAARRAIAGREPRLYEAALATYTGELLPGDLYEEWAIERRDALERVRQVLQKRLAEAWVDEGHLVAAEGLLRDILRHDEADERAHRALIRVYLGLGERNRAVHQYRACVDILRRNLGVDVSRETHELIDFAAVPSAAAGTDDFGKAADRTEIEVDSDVRFVTSSKAVRLAFVTEGRGSPIVRASSISGSHLVLRRRYPAVQKTVNALARRHTVVQYDGQGSGLSQRTPYDFSLQSRVDDLATVIDHLGLDHVVVWGAWSGGPAAIAYTIANPGRVAGLILENVYPRARDYYSLPFVKAYTSVQPASDDEWDFYTLAQATWERRASSSVDVARRAHLLRESMTPEALLAFRASSMKIDLRLVLSQISVPTLVICRKSAAHAQPMVSAATAEAILGAQLVVLPADGREASGVDGDEAMETFIQNIAAAKPNERPLKLRV